METYSNFDQLFYAVEDKQLSVTIGTFPELNQVSGAQPAVGCPHLARGRFVSHVPGHHAGAADMELTRTAIFADQVPISVNEPDLVTREDMADRPKHVVVPVRHGRETGRFRHAISLHDMTSRQDILNAFDHRLVEGSSCNIDTFDAGEVIRLDY